MNKLNGQKMVDENQHIRQSITDILLTPQGSRLQRRDYGSQIYLLLARPISPTLILQIASASVMALKKWEKRINISQFVVRVNPTTNQLVADIRFSKANSNQINQINDLILGQGK